MDWEHIELPNEADEQIFYSVKAVGSSRTILNIFLLLPFYINFRK